jgi:hypothetical protein
LCWDDYIKEEGMDGACGLYGSQEMNIKFWLESFNGRKHLRDDAVDEGIILKFILNMS